MTDRPASDLRVAYLMSRFPKISETFILYEILALERLGLQVEIFPLIREREAVEHREAERLASRAHYARLVSGSVAAAQLHWLRRRPGAYLRMWSRAIFGNIGSPRFLIRAIAVVPHAALMARRMEALEVKHIHAHWATHPALAAYVASGLTGIPYSFTGHAHDIFVERTMLREKIRRAAFVVTISEFNRRFLGELYGHQALRKTVVVHCGTDPSVFIASRSAPREQKWTVVCVASLQPQKGQAHLIEACRRLVNDDGLDLRLLLVGDGETRIKLEAQIARAGMGSRITLLGLQPRHRVAELLTEADVVVQPSVRLPNGKTEGIPVSLMEALAMERPTVATAVSGVPELVQDGVTGLLVPEGDPAAIADALRRLHRDPELARRLGRAGREVVLRDFDVDKGAARLAELFVNAAGGCIGLNGAESGWAC